MAGAPKRRELIKAVAALGGEDAILDHIADGVTVTKLAEELGVSRPMLSGFLNRSSDAAERLARARETSADILAEDAMRIADEATHDNDRAKRLQVSTRQWLAGKLNRARYGESPLVNIAVSADQLMLSALQKPMPPRPAHLIATADGPSTANSEDDA